MMASSFPNDYDNDKHTPEDILTTCQRGDNVTLCRFLSGHHLGTIDVNANYEGRTLLNEAVMMGHVEIVKELLRHGANAQKKDSMSQFPLLLAAMAGHREIAEVLLVQGGVSVNQQNSLGLSALHFAAARGDCPLATKLLMRGAAVDSCGLARQTPLAAAASRGETEMCLFLLANGANINFRKHGHATPLFGAVEGGFVGTAKQLIQAGANVSITTTSGDTPLIVACRGPPRGRGQMAVVDLLLERRCDVNAGAGRAASPLHEASAAGNVDVVRLLLARHANVHATNSAGLTPLHSACALGEVAVARLLCEAGADCHASSERGNPMTMLLARTPPDNMGSTARVVAELESACRRRAAWQRRRAWCLFLVGSRLLSGKREGEGGDNEGEREEDDATLDGIKVAVLSVLQNTMLCRLVASYI